MSLKVLAKGLDRIVERLSGTVKKGLIAGAATAILLTNTTCITPQTTKGRLEQHISRTYSGEMLNHVTDKTAGMLSYAKQKLGLSKIEPNHIEHAVRLAENNGMVLLQYSYDNIGLRTVKSSQLADFARLSENGGIELVKYLHEDLKLGDPNSLVYFPDEDDISALLTLTKNDGMKILKFAQEKLGITRISIPDIRQIAELSEDEELTEALLTKGEELYQISRERFGMWHLKSHQIRRFAEIAHNDGIEIVEYANETLELSLREPYEFDKTEFSFLHKLATNNGLDLLKEAHVNLGLDWIKSFLDVALLAEDHSTRSTLMSKGKDIYLYANLFLGFEGTTGWGLNAIATLAETDGYDMLRYVNTELGLRYINNSGLEHLATLSVMNGPALFRYLHENMGLEGITPNDLGELAGIMLNGRVRSTEHGSTGIHLPDGMKFVEHIHEDLGIEHLDARHIDSLAVLSTGDYPDLIDEVHEKVGQVHDVWDLLYLSKRTALLNERNVKLYQERGIVYFERYTQDLMDEVTRSLDPEYKADKPLALLIHNKNDNAGAEAAFANSRYIAELARLIEGYRLVIYETDNQYGAYDAIKELGESHGKIDLFLIGGHGTDKTVNLGVHGVTTSLDTVFGISQVDKAYLDITDTEELAKLEEYISDDAHIVLVSCSTGKGKKRGTNIANTFSKAFPGRTIYAPTEDSHIGSFILDDKHQLDSVNYCFPSGEPLGPERTYIINRSEK